MSMYCTPTETHAALKNHRCDSCGEMVLPGETYRRWRCFDSGEVGTVKMHPECYGMHCRDADCGGPWEFEPFGHTRPRPDVKEPT